MLATASLGAVWTSCSPDFGVDGIVDRFGQTAPVVLLFCDGYRYAGKELDCTARAAELLPRLPSVRHAVMITSLGNRALPADPRAMHWDDLMARAPSLRHRLFGGCRSIIRSTSSTPPARPACRSAWCTRPAARCCSTSRNISSTSIFARGERLFYFTTCGWMMWNWQVSALASRCHTRALRWRTAARERTGPALADGRRGTCRRLRNERQVSQPLGEGRRAPARATRAGCAARRAVHRQSARAGKLRLDPRAASATRCRRRASRVAPTSCPASCSAIRFLRCIVARFRAPGSAWPSTSSTSAATSCAVGEPGELVCRLPFPVDADVVLERSRRRCVSRGVFRDAFPASGGMVTGSVAPRTAATSSADAATRRSIRAASGSARRRSIARSRRSPTSSRAWWSASSSRGCAAGDQRVVLFVRLREGRRAHRSACRRDSPPDSHRRVAAPCAEGDRAGVRPAADSKRKAERARRARRARGSRGQERRRVGESGGTGAVQESPGVDAGRHSAGLLVFLP